MRQIDSSTLPNLDTTHLLNGIPHGVILIDAGGSIVAANRIFEAVTGYDADDMRGLGCEHVLRSNPDLKKHLLETSPSAPLTIEGDIINANRQKAMMRFLISPLASGDGTTIGYMVVGEDITAIKERACQNPDSSISGGILGHSPKMEELHEFMPILARTDATLLITGETGTGKDLLAEAIHRTSKRSAFPFIKVNCGALPETLLESELFGHVRGAYTGAHSDKPGMFRLAQGGTLFLTEIGDLPLPLQVKLLTVLDDREFYPLGSSKKVQVDVRLITGTNRDLKQMVKDGQFREDLYYRLNVLRAHLPPLRDRGDDILLLVDHFVKRFANNLGKTINGLNKEAEGELYRYQFPGNVRELRNIIEHAVNVCPGDRIGPAHLPAYLHAANTTLPHQVAAPSPAANSFHPNLPLPHPGAQANYPQATTWSEIERNNILQALIATGGNRSLAAQHLGWGRSTLWRKIKRYGLD